MTKKKTFISDKNLKVYQKDGRQVEMESDYNVKESKHLNVKTKLYLLNSHIEEISTTTSGVAMLISLAFSIWFGVTNATFWGGLLAFLVLLVIAINIATLIDNILFRKYMREYVKDFVADEISFNEFAIIASNTLPKKSIILSKLIKLEREFKLQEQQSKPSLK